MSRHSVFSQAELGPEIRIRGGGRQSIKRLPALVSTDVQLAYLVEADDKPTRDPNDGRRFNSPASAVDANNGLGLADLVELALGNNPAIARGSAQVRALHGKWVQVGLPPNPTIGYLGEEIGDEDTAGQQGGFVGQQFITGGKLGLNRNVVAQEIDQAQSRLVALRQRVITDVRTAYYDVLIANREIEIARELVNTSQQAVVTSQNLLHAKEVNEVALLQTQVQAQDARILQRRAENSSMSAWRRLSAVVGVPELRPQPLDGQIENGIMTASWDQALTRLLQESPEIAAATAESERARWALRRACAEIKPNVNVQLAVQHNALTDDIVTGVQVGLPVPIWNRNEGAIRQAQAEIAAAENNIRRLELGLRERLADAFREYASSRFEADKYSHEILPRARRTLELVTRGYRQGEVGYLDQLTAQKTYFQTNLSYIEALRALWRATLRIDGLLLEGSLREEQE